MAFITVELPTTESQLAEEAKKKLIELVEASGIAGFELSEAAMETILIDVIAGIGANAAQVASVVPAAIFRKYGEELIRTPFNEGSAAIATTTWKVVPEAGVRQIEAGTQIEAGSKGFYVETNTEVPASAETVTVHVVAVERGTESNGISGTALQVNPIDWVLEVTFIGESSGGTEEESEEEYLSRLAASLKLQAPRPITAADFAQFILSAPASVTPSGQLVGRATSIDGYNPSEHEFEGTIKTGELTEIQEVTSFTGITKGTELVDAGGVIPAGTTVSTFNTSTKKIVMSTAATALHAKEKIKARGEYEKERTVTTFVATKAGTALTKTAMEDLEVWVKGGTAPSGEVYPGFVEINFLPYVREPSFNKIYIIMKIHVLPGYTEATVKANVEEALKNYVNPATWGNPNASETGSTQWINLVNGVHTFGTLRYNNLIGVAEAVPGCAYVFSGSEGLKVGLTASPTGTSDVVMAGAAPLPEIGGLEVKVG
jgi:hypothetical protein